MRKYLLAAAAVVAIATPAAARDGAGYVGIEGGVLFPILALLSLLLFRGRAAARVSQVNSSGPERRRPRVRLRG